MNTKRVAAFAVLLAMAAAAAGVEILTPTQYLADARPKVSLEQMFPQRLGDWRVDTGGPVQLISPTQEALLSKIYSQTLSRVYVNGSGQRVMLSVAYGGDQSDATRAHRPEVCYPAQGFQIQSSRRVELDVGDRVVSTRFIDTRLGGRHEPLIYWLVVADVTTTSGMEQKLAQIRYGLKGVIPDGMLVRVSMIDSDTQRSYDTQMQFIRTLSASVSPDVRARIFGAESRHSDARVGQAKQGGPT